MLHYKSGFWAVIWILLFLNGLLEVSRTFISRYATLGKIFNFSVPWFPCLQSQNHSICLTGLWQG